MRGVWRRAFTLIELLVTLGIIAILTTLAFPVFSVIQKRAQRVRCTANLKTLSVGASLYLQQNGVWPQIPSPTDTSPAEDFANAWIAALAPFSVPRASWICPANQQLLGNPDYSTAATARIDYIPTPFDDKPTSPNEWPRQPWFIETGDVHGTGNLILFADGSVSDLKSVVASANSGK